MDLAQQRRIRYQFQILGLMEANPVIFRNQGEHTTTKLVTFQHALV